VRLSRRTRASQPWRTWHTWSAVKACRVRARVAWAATWGRPQACARARSGRRRVLMRDGATARQDADQDIEQLGSGRVLHGLERHGHRAQDWGQKAGAHQTVPEHAQRGKAGVIRHGDQFDCGAHRLPPSRDCCAYYRSACGSAGLTFATPRFRAKSECDTRAGRRHGRPKGGPIDLDAELIPLTVPEVRGLLVALVWSDPAPVTRTLQWSVWRRRHQARARRSHYKRRLARLTAQMRL
jgi:hypothetical protein